MELQLSENFYNENTKMYECKKCMIFTTQRGTFNEHLATIKHNDPTRFTRSESIISNTNKSPEEDIATFYIEDLNLYKCVKCNFFTDRRDRMITHLKSKGHKLDMSTFPPEDIFNYFVKDLNLFKCEKCNMSTLRKDSMAKHLRTIKHNSSVEEYKEIQVKKGNQNMLDGDDKEFIIVDILKELDFEEVIHIGYTGSIYDIIIKYKDENFLRGLQVKSLVKNREVESFVVRPNNCGYPNETLIIGINTDLNVYALLFAKCLCLIIC